MRKKKEKNTQLLLPSSVFLKENVFSQIWGKKKKKTCFQVQLLAAIRFAYFSA